MTSSRPKRGAATSDAQVKSRKEGSGSGRWDRTHSTPERRNEQRVRILAAVTSTVANRGLPKTTVQHVIDAAAVGRRTFYEHFDDLPSAVLALHIETGRLLFEAMESAVSAASKEPVEQIRAGVLALLSLIAADQDLARVLFVEIRALGPDHEVRHEALIQRFCVFLFERLASAHAARSVSRAPDELTVFALVSSVEAVALRYVHRNQASRAPEATTALVELILRAFR